MKYVCKMLLLQKAIGSFCVALVCFQTRRVGLRKMCDRKRMGMIRLTKVFCLLLILSSTAIAQDAPADPAEELRVWLLTRIIVDSEFDTERIAEVEQMLDNMDERRLRVLVDVYKEKQREARQNLQRLQRSQRKARLNFRRSQRRSNIGGNLYQPRRFNNIGPAGYARYGNRTFNYRYPIFPIYTYTDAIADFNGYRPFTGWRRY